MEKNSLDETQIQKLLKSPKNSDEIQKGRSYESKLRLITDPLFSDEATNEDAYTDLVRNMRSIIHEDKVDRVIQHFVWPLPVTAISGEILRDINRVFEGRNNHFEVYSDSESLQKRIHEHLEKEDLKEFIEKHGRSVLKNKPNAIVVIDRTKERGAYPIFVDNDRIRGFEQDAHGNFIWVSFLHSKKQEGTKTIEYIAFYDFEKYRVYKKEGSSFTLESESAHGLGYCPARSFLTENANSKTNFRKRSPLLPVVGSLLDWTTYDAGKRYLDNYVPFPIIEKAIGACDNERCDGGFIYRDVEKTTRNLQDGTEITINEEVKEPCPSCQKSSLLGPGTTVNIDATDSKEEVDDRGIFKFISPNTDGLKYAGDRLNEIELKAHLKVTGLDGMITKEAVNQDQVKGSFERAKSVLLGWKKQLELLYIWATKTVIKLQFSSDSFSVSANFGTDWYILTEEQLQALFESAKNIGMPEIELDELYNVLIETKYRSNPAQVERMKLINELSPAPYDTIENVITKKEQGVLSDADVKLKFNLLRYIKRFERENGSIAEFGRENKAMSRADKINTIYNQLIMYANESN